MSEDKVRRKNLGWFVKIVIFTLRSIWDKQRTSRYCVLAPWADLLKGQKGHMPPSHSRFLYLNISFEVSNYDISLKMCFFNIFCLWYSGCYFCFVNRAPYIWFLDMSLSSSVTPWSRFTLFYFYYLFIFEILVRPLWVISQLLSQRL